MKQGRRYMTLDSIADFRELTDIKIKAGDTGLLMIGGGVPKNFVQDTVVCAEILGHEDVVGPQICDPDHRRRRSRRGVQLLDASGSGELGQGFDRHGADGVRRSDFGAAADGAATPTTAATGKTAKNGALRSCSIKLL